MRGVLAAEHIILAPFRYENWAEVIAATARRQEPSKLILKNGVTIEKHEFLRFMVREIFFRKLYTPPYLPIGKNDIVVDIGANYGLFTLFAASRTRNTVYAFEPSPKNFEVLTRHVAVNGLKHVIAHCSAVSDKLGSANLFLSSRDGQLNLLSDQIIPDKIEKYKTRVEVLDYLLPAQTYLEVPTTTLQDIMDSNHIEQLDFLKLDCEGAEGSILHSTPKEYLKRIGKISMEFHDHLSHFDHNNLQKLLGEAGFSTRLEWENGNEKSPLGYIYAWRD